MTTWRDVRSPEELQSCLSDFRDLSQAEREYLSAEMGDFLQEHADRERKLEDQERLRAKNASTSRQERSRRPRRSR